MEGSFDRCIHVSYSVFVRISGVELETDVPVPECVVLLEPRRVCIAPMSNPGPAPKLTPSIRVCKKDGGARYWSGRIMWSGNPAFFHLVGGPLRANSVSGTV